MRSGWPRWRRCRGWATPRLQRRCCRRRRRRQARSADARRGRGCADVAELPLCVVCPGFAHPMLPGFCAAATGRLACPRARRHGGRGGRQRAAGPGWVALGVQARLEGGVCAWKPRQLQRRRLRAAVAATRRQSRRLAASWRWPAPPSSASYIGVTDGHQHRRSAANCACKATASATRGQAAAPSPGCRVREPRRCHRRSPAACCRHTPRMCTPAAAQGPFDSSSVLAPPQRHAMRAASR